MNKTEIKTENEDEDNADGDYGEYQAPETNELCQALYEEAAKCEQSHGFDTGYSNYQEYSNQAEQENLVCKYMSALESGTYDESGEIVIAVSRISSIIHFINYSLYKKHEYSFIRILFHLYRACPLLAIQHPRHQVDRSLPLLSLFLERLDLPSMAPCFTSN